MDLGFGEIAMLLVLGVVMFGPDKIPPLARKAAKVVHFLRGIANDAQNQLRNELGPEYADLELRDLNPRTFIQKHLLTDIQEDLDDIKSDLGSIRDDLKAEGKNLAEIEAAIRSTDEAIEATEAVEESVDTGVGHYWTAAPFDVEAT